MEEYASFGKAWLYQTEEQQVLECQRNKFVTVIVKAQTLVKPEWSSVGIHFEVAKLLITITKSNLLRQTRLQVI